jgi:outer membrane protein insertion porin family
MILIELNLIKKNCADFAVPTSTAQILPSKDKFYITFLLEEGIKYNLGEINIVNHVEKFDETLLNKAILIKQGKVYNSDLIEKTVEKMVEIMSEKSYAFAHIEPVLKRNKEQKIIDIDFVVQETQRIYIDKITIIGNTRTKDEVVRRELRMRDGDPYNIIQINRSKQRIQNLGFFEKVDFHTKRIGNSDKIELEVELKEKKTGELNFGIGYSTVDKATANIGLKERNLMGTGQEVGISVQKSKYSFSGDINYTRPYFTGRPIDVSADIFQYQSDKRNTLVYSQSSSGFTLSGGYSITEFLNHQVHYSLSSQTISDVATAASTSIQSLQGSFVSSTIGHSFIYDRRDNKIDPHNGYYISITQDSSGVGGDVKNLKHTGSAGYYLPTFSDDYILKFLFRGGVVNGTGQDVRSNYAFFLGGNNFRGFEYAGLGPRTKIRGTAVGGNAIGGNIYYVATAEFRFPLGLPKELGINGILFSDNGTLKKVDAINKRGTQVEDSGSMRSTYGLSLAWSSPMGPIRFDFSRIAKKETYDRTQAFRFSFGTQF